jgi:hypothetical protein
MGGQRVQNHKRLTAKEIVKCFGVNKGENTEGVSVTNYTFYSLDLKRIIVIHPFFLGYIFFKFAKIPNDA